MFRVTNGDETFDIECDSETGMLFDASGWRYLESEPGVYARMYDGLMTSEEFYIID